MMPSRRAFPCLVVSLLLLLAACNTESDPLTREQVAAPAFARTAVDQDAEEPIVSPVLAAMNEQLAANDSPYRISKAELIMHADGYQGSSLTLVADDRSRGIGTEWVPGDPRRGGRTGVSYAIDPRQAFGPFIRAGGGFQQLTFPQVESQLEEGMSAWRAQQCAVAGIDRVPVPAGIDPDFIDNLVLGSDGAGRLVVQISDLVQGGWQPLSFFTAIGGPTGGNILGVAFTLSFASGGIRTDIDGNGKDDTGLVEIYYNGNRVWSNNGPLGTIDFFSIITHETGHGMGLGHFGKVFVTKRDAADGLQVADVKFAPKALMNAVYITGRSEIGGTDQSAFCQIWGSTR
ncbi:MAG: hypothetical protein SFU57_08610 [Gemmatimonadales bacterium]|nr:hypothetical protein [Gemmatimonadales bacterium]